MPDDTESSGRKNRQTKDRVLQARIPEQLDDELRDRAENLGLSVSTIVRNVLLNTFDLVEGVVSDSSQIARVLTGRDATPTAAQLPSPADIEETKASALVAWQEAILNKNGVCDQCNGILKKGERAAIGMPVAVRPVLLCLDCLEGLGAESSTEKPPAKKPTAEKPRSKKSSSRKTGEQK